nr:ATP-binding protein [uncultured Blautia sp.]
MEIITSTVLKLDPLQRSLIVAALFMIPLNKRDNFKIRFAVSVLVCLMFTPLISMYTDWAVKAFDYSLFEKEPYLFLVRIFLRTTCNLFQYLILVTGVFYFSCRIKFRSAVYGGVCTYLIQDFAYTVFVFIMPEYVHKRKGAFDLHFFVWKVLVMIIIYGWMYYFFARKITEDGEYRFNCSQSLPFMILIITIGKTLGTFARISYDIQSNFYFNIIVLYDLLLTAVLLISQMLLRREEIFKKKALIERQLREMQIQQYQYFQENIKNINHKCHDLKHMVAALSQEENENRKDKLQELEKSVMIYESQMNTGNSALDTILANTWLTCEQKEIQWTCMADGKALEFMDNFDLYIMLGNALDNAIESVKDVHDTSRRFISLNIWRRNNLVFIKIENYCDKPVQIKDGVPVTTKENPEEHGFGSRSIRSVVEKYQGESSVLVENHVFTLNMIFTTNIK